MDVGNGYGIPGGVAYAGHSEISEKPEPTDYLPEYLKHKLKARGILRDGSGAVTSNAQDVIILSLNTVIFYVSYDLSHLTMFFFFFPGISG